MLMSGCIVSVSSDWKCTVLANTGHVFLMCQRNEFVKKKGDFCLEDSILKGESKIHTILSWAIRFRVPKKPHDRRTCLRQIQGPWVTKTRLNGQIPLWVFIKFTKIRQIKPWVNKILLIFKVSFSEDEEGAPGKWQQQEDLQHKENREEARLQGKQYAPHYTTEKRTRLGELLNPYYEPPQWKSSHFARKEHESQFSWWWKFENGLTLNGKNFLPRIQLLLVG